jgi:hypothetical protein
MVLPIGQPHTPLCESYRVMGLACSVATNSPDVLAAARATFRETIRPETAPDFTLRFWVDRETRGGPACSQACFRGLNHLVYGRFDSESAFLLDLRRRRALGRFSPDLASDAAYWQRVIFPNAVGLMSEALGLTALHCATMEKKGEGLLIAGGSGAGKSTLSLALARRGFRFLSDDWTYFSHAGGRLRAWHLAGPVKLLPDAAAFFPELLALKPHVSLNGEVAFEPDPERVFGVRRALECEPRWLVFVERRSEPGHRLARTAPAEAAARLELDLEAMPPEFASLSARQSQIVRDLASRECWTLEHGETPDRAAEILARLCAGSGPDAEPGARLSSVDPGIPSCFRRTGPDILRRFTPTPLTADFVANFNADAGTVRLETNSPAIMANASRILPRGDAGRASEFLWRLIAEDWPAVGTRPAPPRAIAAAVPILGGDGLYLESIGHEDAESAVQLGFFAVDTEARLAIGFFAEALVTDAGQFEHIVPRLDAATGAALAGHL